MAKRSTPQVSSHGRYRNAFGVVYTPRRLRTGYRVVGIRGKKYYFHRLVAAAFVLREFSDLTQVHHLDHTPGNDVPGNLVWVTPGQNVRFSFATGTRASNAGRLSKAVEGRRVTEEDTEEEEWTPYESMTKAASELGLNQGNVSRCILGVVDSTEGFQFRLAGPEKEIEGEEWRVVEGTTAEVSSQGRFKSTRGVVSIPKRHSSGYRYVRIDGKKYLFHRLVAAAFVPRDSDHLTQVHHLDHTPGNDVPGNLVWVTPGQNQRFSLATGARARPMNEQAWLARRPVAEPAIEGEVWRDVVL